VEGKADKKVLANVLLGSLARESGWGEWLSDTVGSEAFAPAMIDFQEETEVDKER
jgi:hypothetical protein